MSMTRAFLGVAYLGDAVGLAAVVDEAGQIAGETAIDEQAVGQLEGVLVLHSKLCKRMSSSALTDMTQAYLLRLGILTYDVGQTLYVANVLDDKVALRSMNQLDEET